jgi:hypothetical protein
VKRTRPSGGLPTATHGASRVDMIGAEYLGPSTRGLEFGTPSNRQVGGRVRKRLGRVDPQRLLEMEVAVTRVGPEERGSEPFLPQERLDLMTAVEAFTMGSAMVETVVRGRVVYERSR